MNVGVLGLRGDRTVEMVMTLSLGGHAVRAIHLGGPEGGDMPDRADLLEGEGIELRHAEDSSVYAGLAGQGWASVSEELAGTDVVVLGRGFPWEDGAGREAIAWARSAGVRLVAVEGPSSLADVTARSMLDWAEELGAVGSVHVVRDLPGRARPDPVSTADAVECLWGAGWRPLDARVLAHEAERLRSDHGIPLGGRRWRPAGVVTASAQPEVVLAARGGRGGAAEGRAAGQVGSVGEDRPMTLPVPPWGLQVLVSTHGDDEVDAVRLVGDSARFLATSAPTPRGVVEVPEGRLHLGPVSGGEQPAVLDVRPGTYVVQADDDPCGAQLYWIRPSQKRSADPDRSCPVCQEKVVPIIFGFPTGELFDLEAEGEVRLGGCMLPAVGVQDRCARCSTWLEEGVSGWTAVPWAVADLWW